MEGTLAWGMGSAARCLLPTSWACAGGGLQIVELTLVDGATAALMAPGGMLPHSGRMYACNRPVHLMKRKCAAVPGREGIEVFSAKLKRRMIWLDPSNWHNDACHLFDAVFGA